MTPLPRLMVAPNGARHGKAHHPALPVTLPEVVATARACFKAGADGLHLHLRDAEGAHLLDAGAYRAALARLSDSVPGMVVQVTTEAAGRYGAQHQMAVALGAGARLVSVSIREIRSDIDAAEAREFYARCADAGIAVQHILYDVADVALLAETLGAGAVSDPALQLIFVLGRYSEGQESAPADLDPFLHEMRARDMSPDWAVCAFGRAETECLLAACRAGGKLRVGFENNILMRSGAVARDNVARVEEVAAAVAQLA
ncbi:3-keto-5-aminohexanoate cleavage protein [Roseovarius spongiae]|uniref:3-keto-5-aminohexanoate cleavage protein n=1 Tax=Roseovarius spongiae TaxID=2320272 RepID=A0A3A8B5F6_9RHOB|nr:3-keto-5-aminohexanoate cleavage protein [Roseovarius spongiae]RKF14716.1 3-keto-5-aminohexanoate cleavage protein [Roseovarius spongiae]